MRRQISSSSINVPYSSEKVSGSFHTTISEDAPANGSRQMRIDQGLAGKTYQSGCSQIVEEIQPNDDTDPAKESYQSGISVPIGEYGVFQAINTTAAAFDESDIELAELLISHTTTSA